MYTIRIINIGQEYLHPYLDTWKIRQQGSGNSAFGYYLRKIGKWESDSLKIEQNSNKENYNLVRLKIVKENDNEERVLFGGPAVIRIEGSYLLT